jgi:hypothetical protein
MMMMIMMMMIIIIIIMLTSHTIRNMLQSETLSLSVGVHQWFKRIGTKKKNLKLEDITVVVVVVVVSKSGIAVHQILIG